MCETSQSSDGSDPEFFVLALLGEGEEKNIKSYILLARITIKDMHAISILSLLSLLAK